VLNGLNLTSIAALWQPKNEQFFIVGGSQKTAAGGFPGGVNQYLTIVSSA
jgi:hypothetical protein